MESALKTPLVVDIKRGSLEDGPGIRSVVFFKGCPLRCNFCHNPETQASGVEIAFSKKDCIRCAECAKACPVSAIDLDSPGHIDRIRCTACGKCVAACPGRGLRSIGTYYEVDALLEILIRDEPFYRHSGGGVTLSGGECTLYPDYLEALLKHLKRLNIHTAIETSGYFQYQAFREKILPHTDTIFYDIKVADVAAHMEVTGVSNEIIFNNLKRLLKEEGAEVRVRMPLIPEITATHENLNNAVDALCSIGANDLELLPYNPMGMETYIMLGKQKPHLPETFLQPDEEKAVHATLAAIIGNKRKNKADYSEKQRL